MGTKYLRHSQIGYNGAVHPNTVELRNHLSPILDFSKELTPGGQSSFRLPRKLERFNQSKWEELEEKDGQSPWRACPHGHVTLGLWKCVAIMY